MPECGRCVSATHLSFIFACNHPLKVNVHGRNGRERRVGVQSCVSSAAAASPAAHLRPHPHRLSVRSPGPAPSGSTDTRGHARVVRGSRALASAQTHHQFFFLLNTQLHPPSCVPPAVPLQQGKRPRQAARLGTRPARWQEAVWSKTKMSPGIGGQTQRHPMGTASPHGCHGSTAPSP